MIRLCNKTHIKLYLPSKTDYAGNVHYFIHKPIHLRGNSQKGLFALMIQNEFPEKVVKETSIQFGEDCIKEFLEQYDIKSSDHLIFDEVICTKYCKEFIDSILLLKGSVASLWMAMGSEPVTGKYFFRHLIECFVLFCLN